MTRPHFTLHVVATLDAFIARHSAHTPADWASAEEQALFLAAVDAADWSVMGRRTHEAADRPERRRVVFSSQAGGWRRPRQLWVDPAGLVPGDLPSLVAAVRPMRQAAILGGTAVHDWFLGHRAIDRITLSIEPVRFGDGLPIFSSQRAAGSETAPETVLEAAGFRQISAHRLNDKGTRHQVWEPR